MYKLIQNWLSQTFNRNRSEGIKPKYEETVAKSVLLKPTLTQHVEECIRTGKSLEYNGPVDQDELNALKKRFPQLSVFQSQRTGQVVYTEEEERILSIPGCDFVAIDFETANPRRNSACSIGLISVRSGLIRQRAYQVIKPPVLEFSPMNVRVHGIRAADVENAPTFDKVWETIKAHFDGQLIIAHNAASFDMSVLKACAGHYQIELGSLEYSCTMEAARELGWPAKLNLLCKQLTIDLDHHDALSDAQACAQIAIHLYKTGQQTMLRRRSLDPVVAHWSQLITPGRSIQETDWNKKREEWDREATQAHIAKIQTQSTNPALCQSTAEMKLELTKIRSNLSKLKKKIAEQPTHAKHSVWLAQLDHLSAMKANYEAVLNNSSHGK